MRRTPPIPQRLPEGLVAFRRRRVEQARLALYRRALKEGLLQTVALREPLAQIAPAQETGT